MEKGLDILAFLKKAESIPVIDVRTPAEFNQGHIPTAFNIPLFSDEERKIVGTTFKQKGQRNAVLSGLEYAGPKLKSLALEAIKHSVKKQMLVHCWRGGMRSASMAWLFGTVGLESQRLEGGYKSFRQQVLTSLDQEYSFIVIGGLTGSGKTDVLRELKQMGEQVLDLELLANHKGSAFGSLGEIAQCSNEQFENDIFWMLRQLDNSRIIWIEDESRSIGKNILPAGIYRNIRSAPLIYLDVSLKGRVEQLVHDYAGFPVKDLCEAIDKIRPRLGDQAASQAINGIKEGEFGKAVELILRYYDKTYTYGLQQRDNDKVYNLSIKDETSLAEKAGLILEYVRQNRIFA